MEKRGRIHEEQSLYCMHEWWTGTSNKSPIHMDSLNWREILEGKTQELYEFEALNSAKVGLWEKVSVFK